MDAIFQQLLSHSVRVQRPVSATMGDLNVAGTTYEDVYEATKPARIMPVRASLDAGILGPFPEATHVLYCAAVDLKAGYRVERELAATALAEAAEAGDDQLVVADASGMQQGYVVELVAGEVTEAAELRGVDGNTLVLSGPLSHGFDAGTPVRAVLRYDVLGVEDESGAGHHIRAALREVAV